MSRVQDDAGQIRNGELSPRVMPALRAALVAAGFAVTLSSGATPAVLAEASGASAGAGGLEEVIVHARRRTERLEDVPLAVTVIDGRQLEAQSAVTFQDVGRGVPNVRMVSSPQSVSALDVTMRGQTVNRSAIVFDPAVGLYIDGVYVANGQGAMGTLLDIDDVELVRGSQGTLFGRNNTGGSISFLTHRPDLERYSAELSASGGNYAAGMGRAIVNLPVSSDFAVRLAYQVNSREGFGSSVASGQNNFANQHRYQARLGALWTPAAGTEAYFTYEHFEANEVGALLHPLTGPAPGTLISQIGTLLSQFPIPGLPSVTFPSGPYQTDGSYPAFDHAKTDALHLTVTQHLNDTLVAKLIAGYRRVTASTSLDVDASPLPLADTTLFNESNQKSLELQLSDKALGGRLDWVGGLYWFRDNGGAPSVQAPASAAFLGALNQISQATGGQVNLSPYFSPVPVYERNSVVNGSGAAFLHAQYTLTPDLTLAAGVRRTRDERELDENSYADVPQFGQNCTILDLSAPPPYGITGPCPAIHKSVGYGFWSWELSAGYRVAEHVHAYARIGRSQRSGGWNAPLSALQDAPFRPEQLTDYEVGLKSDLWGGALSLNGDVFYGHYDDMQRLLARLNPDGTPVTLVTNAGRARVSGAELEAVLRPVERGSLHASFGWTDARYQSFDYQPLAGGPSEDLAHNAFYQTPRFNASLAAMVEVPTPAGPVRVSADYAWQSRVEFNVINDFNAQSAYGTLNARVALEGHSKAWELALFGNNLTDQRYAYTGGTLGAPLSPSPTISWQVPGAPRTYGIEGTVRWAVAR